MKLHVTRKGRPKRGWALVYAVFAMLVAAASVAFVLSRSQTARTISELDRAKKQAAYVATGALEMAKEDLTTAVANFRVPPFEAEVMVGQDPASYAVTPTGFTSVSTDPAGIQTLLTGYEIESRAVIDGSVERANVLVNVEATPIFQFAVFYTNDLEILPGPSMTLGGRVHTNGSMYLGCNNTLTVDTNYCRAVGGMFRNRKDDPGSSSGTVRIRQWVQNPFDPSEPMSFVDMNSRSQMSSLGVPSTSGYDSNFTEGWDDNGDGDFDDPDDWPPWTMGSLDIWQSPSGYTEGAGYTVQSGEHGVGELEAPSVGSIQMFQSVGESANGDYSWDEGAEEFVQVAPGTGTHEKGFYHAQSDLSLIVYEDGTWDAFDSSGASVRSSLAPTGAVQVSSMYDARQGGDIQTLEIDVELLNTSGHFPSNGLLYAASYGAGEGTDAKGVKLVNGSELAAPFTVVSENSVYVQGDYNTVGKKGAAVIGDAINLLSNAWDGTKTQGTLPSASDTTYNLAIVTGNHDTIGSRYNGGLENLPRFHESWSGKDCNIVGSLVNTWTSEQATGRWVYGGDRYQAPRRNWYYDKDFNSVANLPPFTPMVVRTRDVVTW